MNKQIPRTFLEELMNHCVPSIPNSFAVNVFRNPSNPLASPSPYESASSPKTSPLRTEANEGHGAALWRGREPSKAFLASDVGLSQRVTKRNDWCLSPNTIRVFLIRQRASHRTKKGRRTAKKKDGNVTKSVDEEQSVAFQRSIDSDEW